MIRGSGLGVCSVFSAKQRKFRNQNIDPPRVGIATAQLARVHPGTWSIQLFFLGSSQFAVLFLFCCSGFFLLFLKHILH